MYRTLAAYGLMFVVCLVTLWGVVEVVRAEMGKTGRALWLVAVFAAPLFGALIFFLSMTDRRFAKVLGAYPESGADMRQGLNGAVAEQGKKSQYKYG